MINYLNEFVFKSPGLKSIMDCLSYRLLLDKNRIYLHQIDIFSPKKEKHEIMISEEMLYKKSLYAIKIIKYIKHIIEDETK